MLEPKEAGKAEIITKPGTDTVEIDGKVLVLGDQTIKIMVDDKVDKAVKVPVGFKAYVSFKARGQVVPEE